MRAIVLWLLFALAVAEIDDQPWLDEAEDVEEPYNENDEDVVYRRRRDAYVEQPYEEHIRVKRCCEDSAPRSRRSAEYNRRPRQVNQYEVHEATDDVDPSSPPYEEMLASSANHYHRVYAAPGAPKSARYLDPDVSPSSANVLSPLPSNHVPVSVHPQTFSQQPVQAFAPVSAAPNPVPLSPVQYTSPLGAAHPVDGPVPVASVPLSQPLKQLSEDDQFVAAAGHHHKHAHGHAQGGGHGHHAGHHKELGGKTSKGFKQDHHLNKGGKGFKTDELHKKEYEEAAGQKKKHHDHAGHKGSHDEAAHGQRGSHFGEKKGHKKGHKTKGYHNKYHKDEFHKEHKFYDDYHKSGEHHRYGKFNAKHASNESGKKKAHHVNAGHDFVEKGKKGYSNKGHVDADHKGYNGKQGHEEHHENHSQHGKKGGKEGGSHWGYAKKN